MKYLVKIFLTLTILIFATSITSYATDWSTIQGQADTFINNGGNGQNVGNVNELIQGIGNILTTVGVVIVLAGLLIIGIKYMVATPEEAAKLKTKLIGLAVAGVVIIGAYGIWQLAGSFLAGATGQSISL